MKIGELLDQGAKRKLVGKDKAVVGFIAVSMSVYQLLQSTVLTMQPLMHYMIHLMFILVLTCLTYTPFKSSRRDKIPVQDYVKALLILAIATYFYTQMGRYFVRWPQVDPLTSGDIVCALLFFVFLIFFTKRAMGFVLPSIGVLFLAYAVFGHLAPGILYHRKLVPIDVLDQLMFTFNGIYSSPTAAAATFVFLFVLFGSFFAASGAGDFFYKFSMAVAGKYSGGAGKAAVVMSGLFGMISGSPSANVVTMGSFTIPMMKRYGYDSTFSGAVVAVAGTGGGIMPPIMGTAAFLMVEMAGIPYRDIAMAAAVPGVLYYAALLLVVHFKAKKQGLTGIAAKDIPSMKETLKEGWLFVIPLIILVVMLMRGNTATLSAFAGIVSIVIVSSLRKSTRMSLRTIIKTLEDGALSALQITLSCAVAGCVIAGLMTTGLSGKLSSMILALGGNYLFTALLLTAAICTLLGMGMPVAGAYALTAALCIPALYELGLKPMEAHMFVVYFSTLSAITPPVAVASYAAAGIADASAPRVGWLACRIGIVSFTVPFIFVFEPRLMVTPENFSLFSIWVMISAVIGVVILCAGLEGYFKRPIGMLMRILLVAAGLCLIYPEIYTDFVGIAGLVLLVIQQNLSLKKASLEGGTG